MPVRGPAVGLGALAVVLTRHELPVTLKPEDEPAAAPRGAALAPEFGDEAAADKAAGRAEGHARSARESADQAALDAEAARQAASRAEQSAKDARAAAERADTAATEAEQAAKDAAAYAKEAQEAADRAEKAEKTKQITTGTVVDETGGSIGSMFYVIDRVENIGEPQTVSKTEGCDGWIDKLAYTGNCTITTKFRFKAFIDLYLCTTQEMNPSKATCPVDATVYLGEFPTKELSQEATHTITMDEYQANIDPIDILFGGWIKCVQKIAPGGESGSLGGCGWAALDVVTLFAGKILRPIADAVLAVDAAARTGIAFTEAFTALRALGLSDEVVLQIGLKGLDGFIKTCVRSRVSSAARASAAMAVDGCPVGLIAYNSEEMSHLAYNFRKESGFYGSDHNVAVAKVPGWNDPKTGDFVIGSSGFNGHSETVILDKLKQKGFDPTQITALYTERQPCPNCASALAGALKKGTPITWSVPYHPSFASAAMELLAEYVKRAGGGRMARSAADADRSGERAAHE
ncbi:nucleic acid/nucleotide deaminase domain-containing protein [Streptomyces cinereoruber]|uniref:nucleic acid/nucleotide deaminase domain-containing protein n=1 Tax=Streptomyces cinereoruber TaxID=67260 RepID=UPI003C2CE16E